MRHTQTYVAHLGVWQHPQKGEKPMGLDCLGVLNVGTLVPKESEHTTPFITLLAIHP